MKISSVLSSPTFRKVIRDLVRLDSQLGCRVPLVTTAIDANRAFQHRGIYMAPHVDTFAEDARKLAINSICVARISSTIRGAQAYSPVYAPDGAFARALLHKHLVSRWRGGSPRYSSAEQAVWESILSAAEARYVVGHQPSRELCTACHRLGVWVADLQHGVIAARHHWYGAEFRSNDLRERLPDSFLVWDDRSAEVISSWAVQKGVETLTVGNRWLARFSRPEGEDAFVDEVRNCASQALPRTPGVPTILISLSWGEVDIPNGFIVEELESAIKKTSGAFRWLIRLHPNQLVGYASHERERFIKYFRNSGLSRHSVWESPSYLPLPYVLSICDAHISWASSTTMEAAQCGLVSCLLNPKLRLGGELSGYFDAYIATRKADHVAPNVNGIIRWIEDSIARRGQPNWDGSAEVAYLRLLSRLSQGVA